MQPTRSRGTLGPALISRRSRKYGFILYFASHLSTISTTMSNQNLQVVLAQRPQGLLDPATTFKQQHAPIPSEIPDGHVLIKVLYLSLDPAMRGWLNDVRSYIPPVKIGAIMRGDTVGIVVQSKHADFKKGDNVQSMVGWQQYALVDGTKLKKLAIPKGINITDYLGPLGGTGMTAYFGFLDVGQPKKGDTVVVSGAAGATGSVVGQIAKIMGCTVIGIAGAEDKCAWLRSLGFDVALNYKSENFQAEFKKVTPKLVDVFFDNVGGDILDMVLRRINQNARVVLCGAISQYNATQPKGPAYYSALITQRAKMQGFIVFDYIPRYPEAIKNITEWIQQGKLQRQDYIVDGLENAPGALLSLFQGVNTGKMLVRVSKEEEKSKL